jgi:hypothetical protein
MSARCRVVNRFLRAAVRARPLGSFVEPVATLNPAR